MKKVLLTIVLIVSVAVVITVVIMWPRPVATKVFRNEFQAYSVTMPEDWRGYPAYNERGISYYSVSFNDPLSDQAYQNLLFSAATPGTKLPALTIDRNGTGFAEPLMFSYMDDLISGKIDPATSGTFHGLRKVKLDGQEGWRVSTTGFGGTNFDYVFVRHPQVQDLAYLITLDPTVPGIEEVIESFTLLPLPPL